MISLTLDHMVFTAGLAQVALVIGSAFIPQVLNWRKGLSGLQPLLRQMFWVYAAYILVINLCFGLVSVFNSRDLLNSSALACCLTGFIAAYWISRVLIQFFYFDRSGLPGGKLNRFFEVVLTFLFIALSVVYSLAFYFNSSHMLI